MPQLESRDEIGLSRARVAGVEPAPEEPAAKAIPRRRMLVRGGAWVAALALAVALLDAPPFLPGVVSLTAGGDNPGFNFPIRVEAARQWSDGRLPLWNPFKLAGFPLLGDVTSGALYPGNLPFLLDPSGQRYRALDRVAALHFVLAALSMYVFARSLALGPAAATLAGLVFAGNGVLLFLASRWIQAQNAAVWLPLILASVRRAASPRGFRPWTAIGAGAVALQTLSGYPQYGFYTALLAGAFALVLTIGRDEGRWRPLQALLVVYLLGAALAAVQLLPAIELVAPSRRAGGVSLREFLALPSSPNVLPGLVIPRRVASPAHPYFVLGGVFVGTLAAVLALEGARSTRRENLFLTGTLLLTLLLALGPFTPIGPLAFHVPGLNAFRYPFKHLLEVVFCLAALAGLGAQSLLDGRRGARACVAIGALAAALWIATMLGARSHWSLVVTAVGCAVVALLVLLDRRRAAVALALLVVWLGLAGNREALLVLRERTVFDPPPIVATLARHRATILGPRYASLYTRKPEVYPTQALDYPTELRIPAVHGTSPFLWGPLREALFMTEAGRFVFPQILLRDADQALDVLGVRFVGAVGEAPPGRVVHHDGRTVVVERPTALPALRFVDAARCMEPRGVLRELHRREHDLSAVALLDCGEAPALAEAAPASRRSEVSLLEGAPGFLRIGADLQPGGPGVLIVSQADVPGWRARIDGEPVPIHRAYGVVQALVVPEGSHQVELEYLPDGLIAGAAVSLAALVIVVVLGVAGLRQRSRG